MKMFKDSDKVAEKFSLDNRLNQLAEECAELICVANHYRRGRVPKQNVTEEMADVLVMIDQVMMKMQISISDIDKVAVHKIRRALDRKEWEK